MLDDAWNTETPESLRLSGPHIVHLLTTRSQKIARSFADVDNQVRHALQRLAEEDERILPWVGALDTYWLLRGLRPEHLRWSQQALAVARRQADVATQGTLLNNIGLIYSNLGKQQQALQCYEQALLLSRQVEDKAGEAYIIHNIGGAYSALGNKQQALQYYKRALPLFHQVGGKSGEATTLNNIGLVYSALGDKQQQSGA